MPTPTIPEFITVHLGNPDESARNVRVPFSDYIKNVASSEIYPTWPESALRANILAQISFALNRIYTEWYRSKGYDFDITSSTAFDQKFIEGRDYFDNIVKIVDDIFNDYVVKGNSIVPFFTQYCDGARVQCDGLSQWGTVDLANQGLVPFEILQYYYGPDINLVYNAPISENVPSYPGIPLELGSFGEEVRTIQRQLNRIGDNYPAIPKISQTNGFFSVQTEAAVRKFQEIFNLTIDGVVGKSTWYRIKSIYNGVKELGELSSEGLTYDEVSRVFSKSFGEGARGEQVGLVQYYLAVIGYFDDDIPQIRVDREFGPATRNAVEAFQRKYELPVTGVVDRETFVRMNRVYSSIRQNFIRESPTESERLFPNRFLNLGMTGDDVRDLQRYLSRISQRDSSAPAVNITGTFDPQTESAVMRIQALNNITPNGIVGPLTWDKIVNLAN